MTLSPPDCPLACRILLGIQHTRMDQAKRSLASELSLLYLCAPHDHGSSGTLSACLSIAVPASLALLLGSINILRLGQRLALVHLLRLRVDVHTPQILDIEPRHQ